MAVIYDKDHQQVLRKSGCILASCYLHLEKMLKPGINAGELNRFAAEFIGSYGAKPSFLGYSGFPHALCVSINNEVVHGLAKKDKILQSGDVVSLDLGVNLDGFFTDSAATWLLTDQGVDKSYQHHFLKGILNPEPILSNDLKVDAKKLLINRTWQALQKGIGAVRSGAKTGDIGQVVNDFIKKFGYGNVTRLGGHGVGRAVHEEPFISHVGRKGAGSKLVENMVIAIEPMIIASGSGEVDFVADPDFDQWEVVVTENGELAAHFEHTLMVTKKGCEIITQIGQSEILPIKT